MQTHLQAPAELELPCFRASLKKHTEASVLFLGAANIVLQEKHQPQRLNGQFPQTPREATNSPGNALQSTWPRSRSTSLHIPAGFGSQLSISLCSHPPCRARGSGLWALGWSPWSGSARGSGAQTLLLLRVLVPPAPCPCPTPG